MLTPSSILVPVLVALADVEDVDGAVGAGGRPGAVGAIEEALVGVGLAVRAADNAAKGQAPLRHLLASIT